MIENRTDEGAVAWEAIADGWAERVRTGTDQARIFLLDPAHLSVLGDVSGKRILDAGCGEGRFSRMLADRGARVTGIDLSSRMIALARAAEVVEPRGVQYLEADMTDLSTLPAEEFDIVVAYLSLLDVEDYQQALVQIARVLPPGGSLQFSIVHPCFFPPVSSWEPRKPGMIPLRDHDKLYKKIDNYFPATEIRFRMWPTAPAETINYHRPISEYAHACRGAGLLIRDIIEPVPPEEVLQQRDYLREHRRAPGRILFDCVKTAL